MGENRRSKLKESIFSFINKIEAQKYPNGQDAEEPHSEGPSNPHDSIYHLYIVQLRLMNVAWISHFKAPGYIKDSTMDKFDRTVLPKMIDLTIREHRARETIGMFEGVWLDLGDIFHSGFLSLEQRCYGFDPVTPGYDGPSSNLIVANNISLLKDLQRLDDILSMARNVLTAGEKIQNFAAQVGFDREVLAMINLCIKITARGYDGDGTNVEENKWQGVINGFKKLLITSLQFLSNLVTMNERLKLMLWVELFDSTMDPDGNPNDQAPNGALQKRNELLPGAEDDEEVLSDRGDLSNNNDSTQAHLQESAVGNGHEGAGTAEATTLKPDVRRLSEPGRDQRRRSSKSPSNAKAPKKGVSNERKAASQREKQASGTPAGLEEPQEENNPEQADPKDSSRPDIFAPPSSEPNYQMTETAADGRRKLQEGKQQLIKRLESIPVDRSVPPKGIPRGRVVKTPGGGEYIDLEDVSDEYDDGEAEDEGDDVDGNNEDDEEDEGEEEGEEDEEDEQEDEGEGEDEEDEDEDDSSEDEYDGLPGDDGRGLLTDVPLILGPNEIEVLPMIIMSGIVTPNDNTSTTGDGGAKDEHNHVVNMYTIRCHLLLAQENGRNLLRELLIFVAAWDLREEELYFKFMFKIMEAILLNGLMSFAYGCFKESKDIISPAQAVIMKFLTKIFQSRKGFTDFEDQQLATTKPSSSDSLESPALRCDIQIVHCLFSEFRQNIIPQICALIFLQGQIRHGYAHLEEFPLNLWDMERMYEGVYQYLEFFAILTDHDVWKQLMGDWEVTSEIVTLLRELELAIPKGRIQKTSAQVQNGSGGSMQASSTATSQQVTPHVNTPVEPQTSQLQSQPQPQPHPQSQSQSQSQSHSQQQQQQQQPQPVAVERPYDVNPSSDASTPTPNAHESSPNEQLHDEPADFEWRNLKKLCVLVLSSLVWKNKRLQDQVRQFGGVTAVLSCCTYDEHNPYIREHAIMCLRFLLEGNKENQEVVKRLAEQSGLNAADQARATQEFEPPYGGFTGPLAVPKEVLDQHGYETFVNHEGQVGLRRRGEAHGGRAGTVLMGTGST